MYIRLCVRCGVKFFTPDKTEFRCHRCDPASTEAVDFNPLISKGDIAPGVNPFSKEVKT